MQSDRYFGLIFTKTELYSRMSVTQPRTKFDGHMSTGNRVVPNDLSDRRTDGRTHMTKLIVDFRHFANAPENPKEASFRIRAVG
jgi:hypothetical protein